MKNTILAIVLFISTNLTAQHYYNDIVASQELSSRMKTFNEAKVKTVTATGYDEGGNKNNDFNEWQEVQDNGSILKVTKRDRQLVNRVYYRFDDRFRVINARDSSAEIQVVTDYQYDAEGKLELLTISRQDAKTEFSETEQRQWKYDETGHLLKMWRIINGKDSTEYRFTIDSTGNVGEEQLYRRGTGINPVYYYYDEENRLTDVVRYNNRVKKLVPDISLIYDENDMVIQKITTLAVGNVIDYLIWRFGYNEKGLKTKEAMFGKMKQLKGRIDYRYSFTP
jgi:hypothetical protein